MLNKVLVLSLVVAGTAGCGGDDGGNASGTEPSSFAETNQVQARTLPIPGGNPTPQAQSQPQLQLGPSPQATAGNRLEWDAPAGWVVEAPRNSVRLAQYRLPGPAGDGELVVFYFGPGQGGDAMSNAFRWAGQLSQPDGRPSEELVDLQPLDGTKFPTLWMEITGDYGGGMSGDAIPGAMLLAGIVDGPDAPWFFKLVGPEATLTNRKAEFLKMLRSVRRAP